MAIKIFLLLNALGVGFLLYVLANFLKEESRTKTDVRPSEIDFMLEEKQPVLVVTNLIARSAEDGGAVIPLERRDRAGQRAETVRL